LKRQGLWPSNLAAAEPSPREISRPFPGNDRFVTSELRSGLVSLWHALSFSYWKPGLIVWCLELLNPIPRCTAVVEIDPETDKEVIDLSDICGERCNAGAIAPRNRRRFPERDRCGQVTV
jgi:hypothetical protein